MYIFISYSTHSIYILLKLKFKSALGFFKNVSCYYIMVCKIYFKSRFCMSTIKNEIRNLIYKLVTMILRACKILT